MRSARPHSRAFRRFPTLAFAIRTLLLASCLAAAPGRARAEEPELPPEEGAAGAQNRFTLVEAGYALAIGSKLGSLPKLACFRDLPASWQGGIQARLAPGGARTAYDYLPLADLSLRKLWLGDEGSDPIRNSEYFGIALGVFFGYDFAGKRDRMRPMGSITVGKYWMPFPSRPLGLDLGLDLTALKLPFSNSGRLRGSSDQVIVSCGANLFYAIP